VILLISASRVAGIISMGYHVWLPKVSYTSVKYIFFEKTILRVLSLLKISSQFEKYDLGKPGFLLWKCL
jgi:hypothetical protein